MRPKNSYPKNCNYRITQISYLVTLRLKEFPKILGQENIKLSMHWDQNISQQRARIQETHHLLENKDSMIKKELLGLAIIELRVVLNLMESAYSPQ
jgi:hypothetical protein